MVPIGAVAVLLYLDFAAERDSLHSSAVLNVLYTFQLVSGTWVSILYGALTRGGTIRYHATKPSPMM